MGWNEKWRCGVEILVLCVCLVALVTCLTVVWLSGVRLLRKELPVQMTEEESPEERARRMYEHGFVNLMNYDGSPRRKERDSV